MDSATVSISQPINSLSQSFNRETDTVQLLGTKAPFMNLVFLLNSKAYAYSTRVGPDKAQKKDNDARDIIFILAYMQSNDMEASRK